MARDGLNVFIIIFFGISYVHFLFVIEAIVWERTNTDYLGIVTNVAFNINPFMTEAVII